MTDSKDQPCDEKPTVFDSDSESESSRLEAGPTKGALDAPSSMAAMPTINITNEILRNWKPIDTTALSQAVAAMAAMPTIKSTMGTSRFTESYLAATRSLFASLDVGDLGLSGVDMAPIGDDAAYRAIASASPETAAAIDAAAEQVRLPFWSRVFVRNALAWLLVSVIFTAYVAGTVLFPPWGAVVVAILSASGVTGPSAYKKLAAPPRAPEEPLDGQ